MKHFMFVSIILVVAWASSHADEPYKPTDEVVVWARLSARVLSHHRSGLVEGPCKNENPAEFAKRLVRNLNEPVDLCEDEVAKKAEQPAFIYRAGDEEHDAK